MATVLDFMIGCSGIQLWTLLVFLLDTLVKYNRKYMYVVETLYHTSFNSQSLSNLPKIGYLWSLRPLLHPGGQRSTPRYLLYTPYADLVGPMDINGVGGANISILNLRYGEGHKCFKHNNYLKRLMSNKIWQVNECNISSLGPVALSDHTTHSMHAASTDHAHACRFN